MYNVAVIGDRETVIGFKALGLSVFYAEDEIGAKTHLLRLAKEQTAIIYITETLAQKMKAELLQIASRSLPAVILIPDKCGSAGIAMQNVSKAVERAVGADILK